MEDLLPLLAGALAGRYTLERQVGAGGMATVYLARDLKHDRQVAIKVLKPEFAAAFGAQRFLAEIRTTANLQHPHILPLHDSGEAAGTVYYVMPFVAGESLRDRLTREKQLPLEDALRIAAEVADALHYAHGRGIVHRDIKPENILLQDGHALVADFGIALAIHRPDADERITETGMSLGTPAYMSPEQALGTREVDARSDVYALGCVLYEMLVGAPPFVAPTVQALLALVLAERPHGIITQRDRVPPHVEAAVLTALEKQPVDRFPTAKDFAEALGNVSGSHRTQPAFAAARARRRRVVLVGGVVLAGAAAGLWAFTGGASGAGRTPSVTVLLGAVENRTGDTTFSSLLPELLATTLEQSRTIAVYPRSNVGFALRRMQRDPATPLTEAVGREIAAREGLAGVVLQSLTRLGDSYVLVVTPILPDGRQLPPTRETFADIADLPRRIDAAGAALRRAFGESAAELARNSAPLEQVTSRSLDAVRFYSEGRVRLYAGDPRGAIVLLDRATQLDPEFAMAHEALGIAHTNIFDMAGALGHFRMAADFSGRAPELEREKILGDYAMALRDYDAACPHFEVLVAMRPRDPGSHLSLGWCSANRLDFPKALSSTERAVQVQDSPRTRINLAMVEYLAGDLAKAREGAAAVRAAVPAAMQAWFVEGRALLASGDTALARAHYASMVAQGGDIEVEGHNGLADVARYEGRLEEAQAELEAVERAALARRNPSVATSAQLSLAELALERSDPGAHAAAMARVQSPADPWLIYRVGRAWARRGRADEARRAIAAIEALSTPRSAQHTALAALLRSEVALVARHAEEAVREAEAAIRAEPSTVAYETAARAYAFAGRDDDAVRALEYVVARPQERCDSYDAPACHRLEDARRDLARLRPRPIALAR